MRLLWSKGHYPWLKPWRDRTLCRVMGSTNEVICWEQVWKKGTIKYHKKWTIVSLFMSSDMLSLQGGKKFLFWRKKEVNDLCQLKPDTIFVPWFPDNTLDCTLFLSRHEQRKLVLTAANKTTTKLFWPKRKNNRLDFSAHSVCGLVIGWGHKVLGGHCRHETGVMAYFKKPFALFLENTLTLCQPVIWDWIDLLVLDGSPLFHHFWENANDASCNAMHTFPKELCNVRQGFPIGVL